jgi:hypothetical protein
MPIVTESCRKTKIPIDKIGLEYHVLALSEGTVSANSILTYSAQITAPPSEGIYISGLYLTCASWDKQEGVLKDPSSGQVCVVIFQI